MAMGSKRAEALRSLLGVALFVGSLWVLRETVGAFQPDAVRAALAAVPPHRVALAALLTAAGYAALTLTDHLAFRYMGRPTPWRRLALPSFTGYTFSQNIGLSVLTGVSVRYRVYSAWGVSAVEVTTMVAFLALTAWVGLLALAGAVFAIAPPQVPDLLHLPVASARPLGLAFLALVAGYLAWSHLRRDGLSVAGWEAPAPTLTVASEQVALSAARWALAAGVLAAALPPSAGLGYLGVLGPFLLAEVAGRVSHVPGGLGVFDTVFLVLLAPQVPTATVLGALLLYRAVYYLLPLAVAVLLMGAHELTQRRDAAAEAARALGPWIPRAMPHLLAFTTFAAGAALLFTGALPAEAPKLLLLAAVVPLPIIEASHFLGSVVGVALILLARGLQQRLDAAYYMTVALLGLGAALALLRGFDVAEALLLVAVLAATVPARPHFYRRAKATAEWFTPGWVGAIALALAGTLWLGLFAYQHVEYSSELWWQFTLTGDAPRFLRATVGAVGVALLVAAARLLSPAPLEPGRPGDAELARAREAIEASARADANLAYVGDKALLFSDSGRAFIMYAVEGRSWVAKGDPVGAEAEFPELVWRFRELAARHGGWPVFYQVEPTHLPLYLDAGLTLLKLGEEARVPLAEFSLEGSRRKDLRYRVRRAEKAGCEFEVVPPEAVAELLPHLREVSDAWLEAKRTREKGFSLGYFDAAYLRRLPMAVVRREGRVVAFCNLWPGGTGEELSGDLMRYDPEAAPPGVMEYLFASIMLWGREAGYRWFNLGMAPLSGLADDEGRGPGEAARLPEPLWHRVAGLVYRHGEHFYNYQGLRRFKEKFDPEWRPLYLASPGGLALPGVLANVTTLIAGGLKGVMGK